MKHFLEKGFEIHRGVIPAEEIEAWRVEADRVASEAGSVCVRHLNSRSENFRNLALSESIGGMLPTGFVPVRSILFDKTREQNWPVLWHQDLTIAVEGRAELEGFGPWSVKEGVTHVQAPSALLERMITIRIHLDLTTDRNGALKVIPGSHRLGIIPRELISGHLAGEEVVCECGPGDVLLMSPLLLHASGRTTEPTRRRIIHFEYAPPQHLPHPITWHENFADSATSSHSPS
ncbi:MAG: phytanoyl-CoA dioxygenase family protein [Verrucomicrobiaceae bacterium]|nr:phytanoyl-CoA dioxygenase family protein [Verrucomicrobiaceae bacterium]